MYNVSDFSLLSKVTARLVRVLCGRIEERRLSKRKSLLFLSPQRCCSNVLLVLSPGVEPGPSGPQVLGPTGLRFSDVSSRGVRLSWTSPRQPVLQYRLVYLSAESRDVQEVSASAAPNIC